jgi:hypothetical protein
MGNSIHWEELGRTGRSWFAAPPMLAIGYPDRDTLPRFTSEKTLRPRGYDFQITARVRPPPSAEDFPDHLASAADLPI